MEHTAHRPLSLAQPNLQALPRNEQEIESLQIVSGLERGRTQKTLSVGCIHNAYLLFENFSNITLEI